jgi:vitamin-K-epoxide reductase (warfarin-sensitive)
MIDILLITVAALGFGISVYTYIVEQRVKSEATYKAACDISDYVSCTKPMLSPYSHIFYFSNAVIGMLYYAVVAFLAFFHLFFALFLLSLVAALVTIFLAYLLYVKIQSFCILCTSVYIINFVILALTLIQLYA